MNICPLYSRDLIIVQMLADGYARKQIASEIGITEAAISKRLSAARLEVGISTTEGLVARCVKDGWVA